MIGLVGFLNSLSFVAGYHSGAYASFDIGLSHRIIKSFRLVKTFKVIESNHIILLQSSLFLLSVEGKENLLQ